MIDKVEIGKTGVKVSAIGLGTWQWGSQSWGYGKEYGEEELIEAFKRAVELGINFFDTAEIYGGGLSETILGKALREVRREEVVIASKVFPTKLRERGVRKALERSLRRLNTSYIDLYQVHWPPLLMTIPRMMRALEKLWREGKIRAIGVSNFSLGQLRRAQESLSSAEVASNQVEYSILNRKAEKELIPYCVKEKITLIAYSPLAQGALTGKYAPAQRPSDKVRRINLLFTPEGLRAIQPLFNTLQEIAKNRGKTPAQVALNWIIRWPNTIAIPGAKRPRHAEEAAGAMGWRLSRGELDMIEVALKRFRPAKVKQVLQAAVRLLKP